MFSRFPSLRIGRTVHSLPFQKASQRYHSTKHGFHDAVLTKSPVLPPSAVPSMARLPTGFVLRSLALTSLMSSKLFLTPALELLSIVTNSKSLILNPDRNPILNKILRSMIYDHFCAGTNRIEVSKKVAEIKTMGYQGVILGYSKEIVIHPTEKTVPDGMGSHSYSSKCYELVEKWKQGTLETLSMIGPGDILAVKLTGAGPIAVDAMIERRSMPEVISKAVDEVCIAAQTQGSRLWFDAEQQLLQHGLDNWAIDIMRKHNRSEVPLVYNTIQAYLKTSQANLCRHLISAAQEGWSVGIKLVRGAYIEHEPRSLIHDTKGQTDESYDSIADAMLCRKMPGDAKHLNFPDAALFLATHNAASATKAIGTHQARRLANQPTVMLECGQIQGMADELSCELIQQYEAATKDHSAPDISVPKTFKSLPWGSVAECMQYLHRRAIENKGAVERTRHMASALGQEIWRRMLG